MSVAQTLEAIKGLGIVTQACGQCKGAGKTHEENCTTCKGHGIVKKKRTMKVKVPEGVDDGQVITLSGEGNMGSKGVPVLNGYGRGDQYVKVNIETPKNLTAEQKKQLKEFADAMGEDAHGRQQSFFDKVKDLFS